jgi:cytosine deaminase
MTSPVVVLAPAGRAVDPVVRLRNARLTDGSVVDVELRGRHVERVLPGGTAPVATGPDDHDLTGWVLLPSFVEPHAHLDKALTAGRVDNPAGDLLGAIEVMSAHLPTLDRSDFVTRADAALTLMLAAGTTAVRTHVDVGFGVGFKGLEALVEVRERWRGIVDVTLVALVGHPLDGLAGAQLEQALAEGADVAGGCPHLDPDPARAVAVCLDAAGRAGRPLDLHTDETLDPRHLSLAALADLVQRTGFGHGVVASHCVSLGMQPEPVQRRVSEAVAAAGIAVVALPQTTLFLQGRGTTTAPPRGLTAIGPLRAAGATVAAGGDNLRDPFHPIGRGDALEVAALMVTAGHLNPLQALGSVTDAARTALGAPAVAVRAGSPADLVAVRGTDVLDVLGAAGQERRVWKAGRLVASTTVTSSVVTPSSLVSTPARPGQPSS